MKGKASLQLARLAAQVAEDKLGKDILILDVHGQTTVTETFLFVSAASHLHVASLEDAIREKLRDAGCSLLRTDGQRGQVWRVLDYGMLLIHIMDHKTREFYSIERLWDQGKKISFTPAVEKKIKKKNVKKTISKRK